MSKTGIICTLGPATRSLPLLKKLADSGMTVVRLNFSHGTYEEYEKDFAMIKALNKKYRKNVKILADLEGHRIRVGELANNGKVDLKKGQKLILTNKDIIGDDKKINIDYSGSLTDIKKGMEVFIDDGNLRLTVLSSKASEIIAEVHMDYTLKKHKGVNIPAAKLKFPLIEEKDYQDMLFALKHNVDFVANSFVRNAQDMKPLIDVLRSLKNTHCKLVAKIEDRDGINNLPSILDVCDGIMVARGDMGISIPLYTVPVVQKYIIKKCKVRKKFVITATQMLESMVENPIPTRAEVSDVANAIIDGSDYVMLSAETAVGAFPANAVKIMGDIIKFTEKNSYRL
ncbi:pyruvate kinase [Endomicrobium proavitum]|uniref:Pyruvate kinase n=1 Tax=Endomicrobium proavitum TaxID=1408281 RepID=A0A0G3WKK8_9BACT|nr:pyruvate kinase [Endomicrobium proavitum]AKL98440.1 Pyruvate kinase [Endomicrobium proavitum]